MSKNKNHKTILISSNYAWTIFNFRMGLIKRLKDEGFKVVVLTEFDGYESKILKEVDEVIPLFISRKGINPFIDVITIFSYIKAILYVKPCTILLFTVKPVIYGSIASKLTKVKSISMITGLGTAFIKNSWLTGLVKYLYRKSLSSSPTTFFQNTSDRDLFLEHKLINPNSWKITPGSGIDLDKFKYSEQLDKGELIFLFVGRILKDKGIIEFINAAKIIKKKFPYIRFQLLGPTATENRTAISSREMKEWVDDGVIEYLGVTDDISYFLKRASCIVLPSYREGTSRALLESAAVGRPLIASDVPGCKEIIDDKKSGFLCKVRDHKDLASKIENMVKLSYEERVLMGKNGRLKIENEYNQDIVSDLYIEAIKKIN